MSFKDKKIFQKAILFVRILYLYFEYVILLKAHYFAGKFKCSDYEKG